MKTKLVLLTACFCLAAQLSNAQTIANEKRAVREGDNTINVYYGTNLLSGIYKRVASESAVDIKVRSLGPIGLVYEHLVTDVIGLGAEFGYSHTRLEYHEPPNYYSSSPSTSYSYALDFTTIRAMFRANFHFAESDHFDAYGLVSAGYRSTSFTYTTDNPFDEGLHFNSLIPVGVKPGIGLRYFFNKNIGVNLEIALGTPLMCGGLSFKF